MKFLKFLFPFNREIADKLIVLQMLKIEKIIPEIIDTDEETQKLTGITFDIRLGDKKEERWVEYRKLEPIFNDDEKLRAVLAILIKEGLAIEKYEDSRRYIKITDLGVYYVEYEQYKKEQQSKNDEWVTRWIAIISFFVSMAVAVFK